MKTSSFKVGDCFTNTNQNYFWQVREVLEENLYKIQCFDFFSKEPLNIPFRWNNWDKYEFDLVNRREPIKVEDKEYASLFL